MLNELQKLWHHMSVSSNTHLTLIRSRYSSAFTTQETVITRFDHAGVHSMHVTALDEDTDAPNRFDSGHLKFSTYEQSPSLGTAKGLIFSVPTQDATRESAAIPPHGAATRLYRSNRVAPRLPQTLYSGRRVAQHLPCADDEPFRGVGDVSDFIVGRACLAAPRPLCTVRRSSNQRCRNR